MKKISKAVSTFFKGSSSDDTPENEERREEQRWVKKIEKRTCSVDPVVRADAILQLQRYWISKMSQEDADAFIDSPEAHADLKAEKKEARLRDKRAPYDAKVRDVLEALEVRGLTIDDDEALPFLNALIIDPNDKALYKEPGVISDALLVDPAPTGLLRIPGSNIILPTFASFSQSVTLSQTYRDAMKSRSMRGKAVLGE